MFKNKCPLCRTKSSYNEKYDADFCESCDIWLSKNCKDPSCEYCKDRPDRPEKIYFRNEDGTYPHLEPVIDHIADAGKKVVE